MQALSIKLLKFCAKHKVQSGQALPDKPYRFDFFLNLNPHEKQDIDKAAEEVVSLGYLAEQAVTPHGGIPLLLTQAGFEFIYGSDFE